MLKKIKFFNQGIDFILLDEDKTRNWIVAALKNEEKKHKSITYVFVNDEMLHRINVDHLDHDTLTDIITFPYNYNPIETEIYISIDRVKENAITHDASFENELKRVIIHGVLHMMGYGDKTTGEAKIMREKENYYLSLF